MNPPGKRPRRRSCSLCGHRLKSSDSRKIGICGPCWYKDRERTGGFGRMHVVDKELIERLAKGVKHG